MCDAERLERLTRALRDWVTREGDAHHQAGRDPTQTYLRRKRVLEYVSEPDFEEAIRELQTLAREVGE